MRDLRASLPRYYLAHPGCAAAADRRHAALRLLEPLPDDGVAACRRSRRERVLVIPACERGAAHRRRARARRARCRATSRSSSSTTARRDGTARGRARGRRARAAPPLQPRLRRRAADRLQVRAAQRRRSRRRRWTPTASTTRPTLAALAQPVARGELDLVIGSRFLGAPAATAWSACARRAACSSSAIAARLRPARDGPDLGLPGALAPRCSSSTSATPFPSDYPDVDVLLLAHRHGPAHRRAAGAHGARARAPRCCTPGSRRSTTSTRCCCRSWAASAQPRRTPRPVR